MNTFLSTMQSLLDENIPASQVDRRLERFLHETHYQLDDVIEYLIWKTDCDVLYAYLSPISKMNVIAYLLDRYYKPPTQPIPIKQQHRAAKAHLPHYRADFVQPLEFQ